MDLTLDLDLLREQIADLLTEPLGLALTALVALVYGFAVCRVFSKAGFWGPWGSSWPFRR